jgi:hypothetical protein
MADHMRTELALDALQMALEHCWPAPGWSVSDQGSPRTQPIVATVVRAVNLSSEGDGWSGSRVETVAMVLEAVARTGSGA